MDGNWETLKVYEESSVMLLRSGGMLEVVSRRNMTRKNLVAK